MAFLSYVRTDDEHDRGRITQLRARLEGEIKMHTGKPFPIFQDNKDIKWGQYWKQRLDSTLLNVTFLIPVVTPSYFLSGMCRDEFSKFMIREKQLGENRLILPIYYLASDELEDSALRERDPIAETIGNRNWADWRKLRFCDLSSEIAAIALSDMAATVKSAMKELRGVIEASKAAPKTVPAVKKLHIDKTGEISKSIPTPKIVYGSKLVRSKRQIDNGYYVYTKQFDEIIKAEDLSQPDELKRLSRFMKLRARKLVTLDKIKLDVLANRLGKLLSNTYVTILVDNSGSMRGQKVLLISYWLAVLSELFESQGIHVQILGYTTKAWKGGQSRDLWEREGKPNNPGRLNDLRHIIYKNFDAAHKESIQNLSLMQKEGIFKENIDGEAFLWAFERMPRDRSNLLLNFTDGAPVDDSTLTTNRAAFLFDHLVAVRRWLSAQKGLTVCGVGIGHDVSRLFEVNVTIGKVENLGVELLEHLAQEKHIAQSAV